jgi:hypothetical protein
LGHDEDLVVLMMDVLGRGGRARRDNRLDQAQPVLGMGAVLDDAAPDRPAA